MGYRVGFQCVQTQLDADDLILSAQQPQITSDGKIIRPVRVDDGWYLNNSKIQLSYPKCDIETQIKDGVMLGTGLLLIAVVVFGVRQLYRLVYGLTQVGTSDDN
ncbi:MAG: hypothetical protein Q4B82_04005 [Alysiella sp.]|uniref:hypothetical protein n=1 Tax=Alysiella sp. TaxID=1872483 RepID=UPI0026DD3C24|nr:hypothetical protein [Alysiella sp.]MDO4433724.1 hypothetical protein [Alysiella sp.]